ncbi:hypothetical protein PoHVEF18_006386 [Penicillium ochrochloron]
MSSAQLTPVREMWSISVPEMAFEYEPLLHTLLAFGAAHRATLLPGEAPSLRPVYHGYIDSALKGHRPVTAQLDGRQPEFVIRKIFNGFPPVVPKLFLDFVVEKRPRALAILAHLFALAKSVDNIWWLRGIPEQEVRGIDKASNMFVCGLASAVNVKRLDT